MLILNQCMINNNHNNHNNHNINHNNHNNNHNNHNNNLQMIEISYSYCQETS